MRNAFIALAVSLGVALGSFGMAAAPAAAAMSGGNHMSMSGGDVQLVKHKTWHGKRWVCHIVWKKKKIWRKHHWAWIKVPVRSCHWVWRHPGHPWWW